MTLLLQISDTHFGTERPPVLRALQQFVQVQRPDTVLLSGDITQRARTAQFKAARAFMDQLGVSRSLVIPGNHDIPLFHLGARLFSPYRHFCREFGPELEPVIDTPALLVLGLNTTRWYRHKNGEVSDEQVERVARRLAGAAPAQLRVIVVHQPVAVTEHIDDTNLLRGRERAVQRWSEAGADLILGGHIHLPFVIDLTQRWPALPRHLWAVQAGTALSSRVRGDIGNSMNLVRHDAAERLAIVERWDYLDAEQGFQPVHVHRLALGRIGHAC